jgi:hypothetical protein
VIECGGRPAGGQRKKGADRGVDGVLPFLDGANRPRKGIISVKAGQTGPAHVRELIGTVQADKDAEFGVLVTVEPPTALMNAAALAAGTWQSQFDGRTYRKVQLLCAHDLLADKRPEMPQAARTATHTRAARERPSPVQPRLQPAGAAFPEFAELLED